MSFLKKIFGGGRSAADGERLLQDGEGRKALDVVERLLRDQPTDAGLLQLQLRAQAATATAHLDKAAAALDDGFPDDALEWLHLAGDVLPEDRSAAELQPVGSRLDELRSRSQSAAAASEVEALERELAQPTADDGAEELQEDFDFEILVETLLPPVAEAFRQAPAPFAESVVALANGEVERALELLDGMVEVGDEHAAVALERGRALLAVERADEAVDDFERAWSAFGDEPLDHTGSLALPELWCEAMLLAKRPADVVERLVTLAEETAPRLPLLLFRVEALRALERWSEVETLLRDAAARFPGQPQLQGQLAFTRLRAAGVFDGGATDEERLAALVASDGNDVIGEVQDSLEENVKAVMRQGGSGLDPLSVRLLAEVHLAADEIDGDRVEELLGVLEHLEGGRSPHAVRLRVALLEGTGRAEQAQPLREVLERLAASPE